QLQECQRTMNGIESGGKLPNFLSDAMTQIPGEMRKTVLDPLRNPFPAVGHQHSCREKPEHERDQTVSREMNPVPYIRRGSFRECAQLRGQKDGSHQQNRKTADVKNAL